MPTGPQVDLMSNSSPRACLARLASHTAWNSGVSGGFWPRPGGLAGSQAPTGLPRIQSASQSGSFLASSAWARNGSNSAAARTAAPIELLVMGSVLLAPAVTTGAARLSFFYGRKSNPVSARTGGGLSGLKGRPPGRSLGLPAWLLRGREIPQVGRRLVLAGRHQIAVAAHDVVVPADEDVMVVLGTVGLGPQRLRPRLAMIAAGH